MSYLKPLLLMAVILSGCARSTGSDPLPSRAYRMGFSSTPPVPTVESVLATVNAWNPHADIALVTQPVPWRALLADTAAAVLVRRELHLLVELYRQRSLPVIVQLDVTDGLARERESPDLVALGRSLTEPAVQDAYRQYLLAVDSILKPDYLGLAMEVNLVRVAAPAAVYSAVVSVARAGAQALAAQGSRALPFVSFQVETAWGRFGGGNAYVGIDRERSDFPFIQAAGLSAYPFLGGYSEPEDVPLDYYARLTAALQLPALVVEGGWTSASVEGVASSPERQARWIRRQVQLADHAELVAVTQITYTDLDLSAYSVPAGSILPLFAHLGLVDAALRAKPALQEWRSAFSRPLRR